MLLQKLNLSTGYFLNQSLKSVPVSKTLFVDAIYTSPKISVNNCAGKVCYDTLHFHLDGKKAKQFYWVTKNEIRCPNKIKGNKAEG